MARKRIRYILRSFPKPFGGPLQIRHHVRALADAGYDAAIVTDSLDDQLFYDVEVPTILNRDYAISADDICVIPEGWRDHFLRFKDEPGRRICFCQNQFYLFKTFENDEGFASFGIDTVMCCSRQVANHVERHHGVKDVVVVPCGVVVPVEAPTEKTLSISFMPRKAALDAGFIRDLFRRRNPNMVRVPWVQIDGRGHADAMALLGRSSIFLSLSYREGFGLPPLEAMARRTLPVGFHGGGGLEYVTPRNGTWIAEGDLSGCADALADAVRLVHAGAREVVDKLDEGRATAARYGMDAMRERLFAFWSERV